MMRLKKAEETIILFVSKGKEEKTVLVPELSGMDEASARAALEASKLTVGNVSYEFNSDIMAGSLISQSISANTEVKEGTPVDLVISNGAESKT